MSIEKFIKDNKTEFDDKRMPSDIDFNFENRLKQELGKPKRFKIIRNLSIAASFTLLVTLGYLYNENRKQQLEFRDSLVLALGEETNSSQLEAIYTIEDEYKAEDEKILNAYFKILKAKSNSNSKIAIIDALLKFPNNQQVRDNLIEALGNEKEPLVQLKLIKSVAILREQRAKKSLKTIIEDDESLPLVKGNASALLAMLNN
ncbi:HEAT repeat domain-containing protein [Winogradskyella immobilis]|uniref:HEAT repeat domain-containing protein n=1 Tax=Winogradskyella immobilis TaxID=2816852 RepID=A0ABS8EIW1_9FLAO|nr:HEAT repeat domain-containing protein [Winogradskyella immobilis]MCC1483153.1 HEAT repeat domain-containing protein [Winogradskyella immobilis]MCG0015248.1 HEAT repeat domain-containing protein [Winogradskyella immobilis]